ncbi:DUF1428 domain-containing protein [Erythrobacteraceae bacterium CFH 75059]|uniref:DUF1428 domain-containing protein n=1 Tax=Qipengyuania thermophila TaxID=2509361 RepID=UPI00101F292A|nr:DUF1428 domain-containing protein [Qipengyuania thermophila]TCD04929.1 DUF1428 domain-containing protein [Erythrobacteraceae bacterium CFH 75059]
MYVQGFIVPVAAGNKDAYAATAERFWPIARDHGALSHVECWEEDVRDGEVTDFRRAVDAREGERIVFAWMIWPDKATADAAHEKVMADPRMAEFGDMPFDGARMVHGGFTPLVERHA